jgi:hypothetical protein
VRFNRFKSILLAISLILLPFLAINSPVTASPVSPPPTNGLIITTDSADRVTGRFTRGSSFVELESASYSPASASATLNVNGKLITVTRDLEAGTCTFEAEGVTLLPEDREVLLGLVNELSSTWIDTAGGTKNILPGHKDLAMRLAILMAEAPMGMKLTAHDVPRPAESTLERTDTNLVEECAADDIATTDPATEDRMVVADDCQQDDEDGIRYFSDCDTYERPICYDSRYTCFNCRGTESGPDSDDCMGECGPGCNGLNIYTYDCGDHDRCVRICGGNPINPLHADCSDEFLEAEDDFLWGYPNCYEG